MRQEEERAQIAIPGERMGPTARAGRRVTDPVSSVARRLPTAGEESAMDPRKPTMPAAPELERCARAGDARPRYEPPRIVKRRSVVRATGQLVSTSGPQAGGLPAHG